MLVKDPPVAVTDKLRMLGITRYPIYLFEGSEEGTVFEGGVGAIGPSVRKQMDELSVSGDFVKQIVLTHAHPDHVMAVPLLREMFPDAVVLASEPAAGTLAAEKAMSFFAKMDNAFTGSLLERGLIAEEDRPQPPAGKPIAVDRIIAEGDTVAVDADVAFAVLETPGHSDCSLSFHRPDAGILLVSDALGYYLPEHDYWWPDYFTDYKAYLDSIRRLAAMNAEILCLGHNVVIKGSEDVKACFQSGLAATEAYHQRIVDEAKAGEPIRQIAEELGSEVYEKTQLLSVEFFQKNCNLLVKQSLRAEGMSEEK